MPLGRRAGSARNKTTCAKAVMKKKAVMKTCPKRSRVSAKLGSRRVTAKVGQPTRAPTKTSGRRVIRSVVKRSPLATSVASRRLTREEKKTKLGARAVAHSPFATRRPRLSMPSSSSEAPRLNSERSPASASRPQPSPEVQKIIELALKERMFLLRRREVQRSGGGSAEIFAVMELSGDVYNVRISTSPHCNCTGFAANGVTCKHVLFVWLKALRADRSDPRIWQERLTAQEVQDMLHHRVARLRPCSSVCAPEHMQKRYEETMAKDTARPVVQRRRKLLAEDDCPICYEDLSIFDELSGRILFCTRCGANVHQDCFTRWFHECCRHICPMCRQHFQQPPEEHTQPGEVMPLPSPAPLNVLDGNAPASPHKSQPSSSGKGLKAGSSPSKGSKTGSTTSKASSPSFAKRSKWSGIGG